MKAPRMVNVVDFLAGLPLFLVGFLATMTSFASSDLMIGLLSSMIWYAGSRLCYRGAVDFASNKEEKEEG